MQQQNPHGNAQPDPPPTATIKRSHRQRKDRSSAETSKEESDKKGLRKARETKFFEGCPRGNTKPQPPPAPFFQGSHSQREYDGSGEPYPCIHADHRSPWLYPGGGAGYRGGCGAASVTCPMTGQESSDPSRTRVRAQVHSAGTGCGTRVAVAHKLGASERLGWAHPRRCAAVSDGHRDIARSGLLLG